MISRVRIVRFKRFVDQEFDLSGGPILLAGPNNSGKTTLLHAISVWNLAVQRWKAERGTEGGQRRISVVLDEFTALPLREMNLLWLNRHTARRVPGVKQPKPAPIYIQVYFSRGAHLQESLTMEILYANEKLVYVRPVRSPEQPERIEALPEFALDLNVVHVPAFSGIGTQEPRHAAGIQSKLIGEGRPGEIVRNLLLDVWEKGETWKDLKEDVERLFQCELLDPEFSDARPYILCEYRPNSGRGSRKPRGPRLDIANAGSGFHQVLLLLAFFHARPAAVLLLDEPDAHLHFILQREIFDLLRRTAQRRRCQLVVATHAEVLLDGAEPEQIISFVGPSPRRLLNPTDKARLRDALRQLTSLDLLQADHVSAVLYVEDESDYKILREWAAILEHRAADFLEYPYVVPLKGKGQLSFARRHFSALRLARPTLGGLVVVDRDDDEGTQPGMPGGLTLHRWRRYEIENYLLNPAPIKRLLEPNAGPTPTFEEGQIDEHFRLNFPAHADYRSDLPALSDLKAGDFLVHLLSRTSQPLPKRDLFMLAARMTREEIHPEVVEVLDKIERILPATVPAIAANETPDDSNGIDDGANGEKSEEY